MPLVEISVFEDELSQDQSQALIEKITTAITEVTNDKLRPVTWIMIKEIKDYHWGVGGKALTLNDVKQL